MIVNKKNLKLLMGGLSAALFISTCDEILDVSPPDVSFVYPKNDQTVSSSFTIELDVSDNKEVDEVKLYYDYEDDWYEEELLHTISEAPWSTNISFSLSSSRSYTFRAVAYDKVGNFSEASVSSVTVIPGGGGGGGSGPSITVTSPNGGESWAPGSTQNITWTSSSAGSYVIIHLYKNGSYNSSIAGATANDGSYSWSIPSSKTESDYYTVKITDYYDSSVYDYSNGYFSIVETSCATPTGLYTSNISSDQATLNWNSVSSANSYNLRARATGQSSWNEGNFTGTSINFTGLTGGTQYEWQVQAVCSGSNTSSWSSTEYFTTASGSSTGEDCDDAYYCSECNNCESNCCPNYCSGNYYYYNRSCSNGFCVGSTSDYCPNGCDENGCL